MLTKKLKTKLGSAYDPNIPLEKLTEMAGFLPCDLVGYDEWVDPEEIQKRVADRYYQTIPPTAEEEVIINRIRSQYDK